MGGNGRRMGQYNLVQMSFADSLDSLVRECGFPDCHADVKVLRNKYCPEHRGAQKHNTRTVRRTDHVLRFTGIDGEGIGNDYVLLGVGENYRTWPHGVKNITEIFSFLYECFLKDPGAVYCGFYLRYDFNMWLKLLPRERAHRLLTDAGQKSRIRKTSGGNPVPFPVRYQGWEFDMLGYSRLKLRPEGNSQWLWINDAGPFFQTSLLNVIDPSRWPEPVVTQTEYDILAAGKARRSTAVLDSEMIEYNRLENIVLARVLQRLNKGFTSAGVRLNKRQWFGPGQAAQTWMHTLPDLSRSVTAVSNYFEELQAALTATYYGGWFEIMAHGHAGTVYEYDLNSAYPAAIANLPCACGEWSVNRTGSLPDDDSLAVVACRATGSDRWIGGLPFRTTRGTIMHPRKSQGWYWWHEILAAQAAGLIDDVHVFEYWQYEPCGHPPPLAGITRLYKDRLKAGKDTPEGKARKLVYNSVYGKFAQSVGQPRFGNALYASLITSDCRTRILNAIATHPDRSDAVVMVATDGIYFTSPHDGLPVSDQLGEWSLEQHTGLTLFKPGVYWDDKTRARIRDGRSVAFKARGISAADFAASIGTVDDLFTQWVPDRGGAFRNLPLGEVNQWPEVTFTARFAQVSVVQAVQWTEQRHSAYKRLAGQIRENMQLKQTSDPWQKRQSSTLALTDGVWRTKPYSRCYEHLEESRAWSQPYEKHFGHDPHIRDFLQLATPDGPVMFSFRDALMGE